MKHDQKVCSTYNYFKVLIAGTNPIIRQLGSIGQNTDMFDVMHKVLNKLPLYSTSKKAGAIKEDSLFIDALKIDKKNRQLSGEIYLGSMGISSEIINTKNPAKSYKRTPSDAELICFRFLIDIPAQKDNLIIATQTLGLFNPSGRFMNHIIRETETILKPLGCYGDLKMSPLMKNL